MVHYSSEFYSDDDLKDWPPISSFAAFMPSVFFPWLEHIFRRGLNMTFMISQLPSSCSISVLHKKINIYIKAETSCESAWGFTMWRFCMSTFSFSLSPPTFLSIISLSHKCRKLKDLVLLPFPTSWTLSLLISLI